MSSSTRMPSTRRSSCRTGRSSGRAERPSRQRRALDLRGSPVLELGAGLGLPSLAAALGGAHVLATDWAEDAVELLRLNAGRNRVQLRAERVRWDEPEPLLAEAPWSLVLGADLLYERRNADQLLELLPRLGADVLLADPGRPFAKGFLERASARGRSRRRRMRSSPTAACTASGYGERRARGRPRRRRAPGAATAADRLEADPVRSDTSCRDDGLRAPALRHRLQRPAPARDRRARDRDVELRFGVQHVRGRRSRRRAAPATRTCAHFIIDRDGTIYQLVRLNLMCRHTVGLNWAAIGIEHVASPTRRCSATARRCAARSR